MIKFKFSFLILNYLPTKTTNNSLFETSFYSIINILYNLMLYFELIIRQLHNLSITKTHFKYCLYQFFYLFITPNMYLKIIKK